MKISYARMEHPADTNFVVQQNRVNKGLLMSASYVYGDKEPTVPVCFLNDSNKWVTLKSGREIGEATEATDTPLTDYETMEERPPVVSDYDSGYESSGYEDSDGEMSEGETDNEMSVGEDEPITATPSPDSTYIYLLTTLLMILFTVTTTHRRETLQM